MALFAALIAPYFIDWSSYRTAFEAEAGRIIGQPVRVRGDADARLLPFPSVTFNEVVVGDDAEPAMTISRFSMDAELAPFLRGEVRIFDMRVDQPSAVVRILDDGRLDWALKRKPSPPGDLVVLEKVSITDADITIVDEQNGRMHHVRDIEALVSAGSLSGPWSIEAEGEIEGHRGGVSITTGLARDDGSLRMRVRLAPDEWPAMLETEGEARIEDNKPLYDGLFTFTGLSEDVGATGTERPLIVAKGDFAATNERLAIKEWRAEIGLSDDPYIVTGQTTIDTGPNPDFLLIADGQQINMDRLGTGAEQTEGSAAIPIGDRLAVFNALIDRLPPPPLPGRVSLNLPAIVAGDTTLREISLDARPDGEAWLIDRFSANLPGRTIVEARGRLVSGDNASFDGALTVASTQPSGLANWLAGDVDPVIRRLGAAGFSANVNLSAALQRFEALEVAVGPAILKGRLERELPSQGRPSLSVELTGDTFDVDAVRALALLAGAGRGTSGPLTDYNLAARIKAGTLTRGPYSAEGVEASLLWRDQALTLERLTFDDLAGASGRFSANLADFETQATGRIEGEINADSAQGLFRLAGQLTGGHALVQRLAQNAYAYDNLEAAITLELDAGSGLDLAVNGEASGSSFSLSANGPGLLPGGSGGARMISLEIDNPEAYRLLEQAGFAVLPLEGEGPASARLDVSGSGETEDLAITATVRSGSSSLTLEGTGTAPSDGPPDGQFSLALDSPDVEPFAVMFSMALPRAGAGLPLTLNAALEADKDKIVLGDLDGSAAGNRFSGRLEVERGAEPLAVIGTLGLDHAGIAWLSEVALGPSLLASDGATWNSEPFLPPAPGTPDLRIALEADRFDLGRGGLATGFKADLTTASGIISLAEAEADWFGGRIGGDMSLTNADGAAFLLGRIEVTGADLSALDQAVRGARNLKGVLDASVSLEGTGTSIRDVVASLAGGGQLVARDLTLDGIDPGAFARILGAADREGFAIETGAVSEMVARFMVGGEIGADRLEMPFTLTGGVLRFSSTAIDAVAAALSGDARVDLLGLKLQSDWRLAFDPGVEAIAGGDPSVVLSLAGLLVDPALSIEASQITNYLSMRAFERERRKVELLQAGVVEKQRLRREVALLRERQAERDAAEAARIAAEEAARLAAEEAARRAAEAAALEAQRAREAEAEALAEARARREEAAREAAREAGREAAREAEREAERQGAGDVVNPPVIERRPLAPPVMERSPIEPAIPDPPSAIADDPPPPGLPELQFDDLPGVNDPIRSLIAPDG